MFFVKLLHIILCILYYSNIIDVEQGSRSQKIASVEGRQVYSMRFDESMGFTRVQFKPNDEQAS